jgi:hypothetical protein
MFVALTVVCVKGREVLHEVRVDAVVVVREGQSLLAV